MFIPSCQVCGAGTCAAGNIPLHSARPHRVNTESAGPRESSYRLHGTTIAVSPSSTPCLKTLYQHNDLVACGMSCGLVQSSFSIHPSHATPLPLQYNLVFSGCCLFSVYPSLSRISSRLQFPFQHRRRREIIKFIWRWPQMCGKSTARTICVVAPRVVQGSTVVKSHITGLIFDQDSRRRIDICL